MHNMLNTTSFSGLISTNFNSFSTSAQIITTNGSFFTTNLEPIFDVEEAAEDDNSLIKDVIYDLTHPSKLTNLVPDIIYDLMPESIKQQIPKRLAGLLRQYPEDLVKSMTESNMMKATKELLRTSQYPWALITSPILPLLLLSLVRTRHYPITKTVFQKEYDYIVVGAGTAGSVVASRLSERHCVSVLLLEAGGDPPILTDVPMLSPAFFRTNVDWGYETVPLKHTGAGLNGRKIQYNSGKMVGGTSVLNAMFGVRGNRRDYNKWAEMGGQGWSYEDVLPYFLKLEDYREQEYLKNEYHAVHGPMTIERPSYESPLMKPLRSAAEHLGYKFVDSNGDRQTGFYQFGATMRNGERCSTGKAYLIPAENRTNLDILTNAMVTKIIFKGKRAIGVQFDHNYKHNFVRARREIILCAGSIGSPQLLMLSGIGPREELQKFKIPLIENLMVGENLQDHVAAPVILSLDIRDIAPDVVTLLNPLNQIDYIEHRINNMAGTWAGPIIAFLSKEGPFPSRDAPDYELYFATCPKYILQRMCNLTPQFFRAVVAPHILRPSIECISQILQPKSVGYVRLSSTNPYDKPLIQPNFYENYQDVVAVRAGMKTCRLLCKTPAMQTIGCKEIPQIYPGCEKIDKESDAYLECMLRSFSLTIWHKSGTAKMGAINDQTAVVDPELKVRGIEHLRVADGSIMPIVPSGNTNLPIMMIGEKVSDMIKETIRDCGDIPGVLKGVKA